MLTWHIATFVDCQLKDVLFTDTELEGSIMFDTVVTRSSFARANLYSSARFRTILGEMPELEESEREVLASVGEKEREALENAKEQGVVSPITLTETEVKGLNAIKEKLLRAKEQGVSFEGAKIRSSLFANGYSICSDFASADCGFAAFLGWQGFGEDFGSLNDQANGADLYGLVARPWYPKEGAFACQNAFSLCAF